MNQMIRPNKTIAIIRARWHAEIVDRCVDVAKADLEKAGYSVEVIDVPGAFEIPLLASKLAETGRYAAIIGSAFVVNGGIYRHDFVSAAVIDGMMRAQLDSGVPVFSTVLTPHNYQEVEAMTDFFLDHFVKKGREVAEAVIETLPLHEKLQKGESVTA